MFKIYFDSSPEKNSILGITYDTIFTVFITIIIFILGYIVAKKIDAAKENSRLKDVEEYFYKLISILEKPINRQKISFINFANSLKSNYEQHLYLDDVSSFRTDQLYEVNNKDLYAIFIKKKKGDIALKTELFCDIRFSIEYIDEVKKNYKGNFIDFINKLEKESSVYRSNIKLINDYVSTYSTENNKNKISKDLDPFLDEILQSFSNWLELERYNDMYIAIPHLIEPIREICRKYVSDQRANILLKPIMECIYAYKNIRELKYINRKISLLDARALQTSLFKLKLALNKFEKL